MKSTITAMKKSLERLGVRVELAEGRISKVVDGAIEGIQSAEWKEKNEGK